ncbi:MAG: hypothetical protein J6R93_00060, partial [Tidjanibacter sp.]|nr:hypothetical protein [Tidjanibacter sp.]
IKDRQFHGSIYLASMLLVTYPVCGLLPVIVMLCSANWWGALSYFVAFPLSIIFSTNYMRWAKKLLGYARFVCAPRKKIEEVRRQRNKLYGELREII